MRYDASVLAVLIATTPLLSAPPASAPANEWQRREAGQTLIAPMASAPYPHASRESGFTLRDKTFPREPHYTDPSVALFVPKGYRTGEPVDLLVYFHGHQTNLQASLDALKQREQIAASGRNVIAVFPQGPKNASDSGCGKLEEKDGLKRLVEEVLDRLAKDGKIGTRKLGRVLLAGHSGAYKVIAACIEHGGLEAQLTDVCLLDATYGELDKFVDWAKRRSASRLFSIFTDHLAAQNVYLMTHLRQAGIGYELAAEQNADAPLVRDSRVLLLHAEKLNHNGTVQWLQRWLAATSLPSTRPSR